MKYLIALVLVTFSACAPGPAARKVNSFYENNKLDTVCMNSTTRKACWPVIILPPDPVASAVPAKIGK